MLGLLVPGLALGQIYAGTEAGTGAVVLSNFPSREVATVVVGTVLPEAASGQSDKPAAMQVARVSGKALPNTAPSAQIRSLVNTAANRHKLSPALLNAVISAESAYDPRAVSPKGAIGLMQLLPATGQRFGARDLFSAEQNVDAGAGYLRWLMAMFDNHLDLVLAAYNAGEKAVVDAGCRIPAYPETQAYVQRILADLKRRGEGPRKGDAAYAGGCA